MSEYESASSKYHACQFSSKTDNFYFFGPNLPKNEFWDQNSKSLSPDLESAPPRYHTCQFLVKTDDFEFFGVILEKWPNYMRYFGSCNVDGVAESWMEAETSWVEVDGAGWRWLRGLVIPFFNTGLIFTPDIDILC